WLERVGVENPETTAAGSRPPAAGHQHMAAVRGRGDPARHCRPAVIVERPARGLAARGAVDFRYGACVRTRYIDRIAPWGESDAGRPAAAAADRNLRDGRVPRIAQGFARIDQGDACAVR